MESNSYKMPDRIIPFDTSDNYEDIVNKLADIVADGYTHIILDMYNIKHLASRQVSIIVMLHKELKPLSGELELINVSPSLKELFSNLNLDSIVPMEYEGSTIHTSK